MLITGINLKLEGVSEFFFVSDEISNTSINIYSNPRYFDRNSKEGHWIVVWFNAFMCS